MTATCVAHDVDARDLERLPLFAGLTRTAREVVAEWLDVEQVGAGYRLSREGAAGYALVVLHQGSAVLTRADLQQGRLGPGDWFGDIAPTSSGRSGATVVTDSAATVYLLGASSLRQMDRDLPGVTAALRARAALDV